MTNSSPTDHRARLLITGGSSSLGREIVRQARANWEVVATYWTHPDAVPVDGPEPGLISRYRLDLRDRAAVVRCLARVQPAAIIHTAGSNRSPDMTSVIVNGTRYLVEAATAPGGPPVRLVHLSSDIVFDGTQAPYTELDRPSPIHDYGRAKAVAESIVAASGADAVIVRTSLIYSLTGQDHNSRWLRRANASGEQVTLFTDEFRCPILVASLAAACLELVNHPCRGILHVAGSQRVNRWQFGRRLLSALGEVPGPNIQPGPTPRQLVRPRDCSLDIRLARRVLSTDLPGIDQVLGHLSREEA